ncbi:E3 ubiquitin-protein ligase pub1 [Blastocladiella emersonii ATCC 22665]|nr:E3 ubiquitin-protein ligase pub1 [Blastocladiella emersonii ATCC 22665]
MAARTVNGLPPALDETCRSLYVGNLDPRVSELMLEEIFRTVGEVTHAKIIPDKNYQHGGLNFGFIDMVDHRTAQAALETLNGRKVIAHEIKVNWAYQGNNASREDTTNHHHVFVGDLSSDVTDQVLFKAFSAFGTLTDARVMWDMNTGKSRRYGFLAFRERDDAERAINTMNGEWLGGRSIRVNWANQKNQNNPDGAPGGPSSSSRFGGDDADRSSQPAASSSSAAGNNPMAALPASALPAQPSLSYDVVVNQSPPANVTVYVGNLAASVRESDLFPCFSAYGYVHEVRLQHDRGFAFVKMDTHENAAMTICYLNGFAVHGRPLKASWGKDKFLDNNGGGGSPGPQSNPYGAPAAAAAGYPAAVADPAAVYQQQYAQYYGAYAAAPSAPAAATATAPIDPATLPPLTDPIAAAAAAAAQAAVTYQIQLLHAQQHQAAAAAPPTTAADGTDPMAAAAAQAAASATASAVAADPSANAQEYYAYYYAYYYQQAQAASAASAGYDASAATAGAAGAGAAAAQ